MSLRWLERVFTDDRAVLVAVAMNACVLFALGFHQLRDAPWLLTLDAGFTLWFTIEAAVKIRRAGWQRYIDVGWNRFDFALVVLSAPSLLLHFLPVPDLHVLLLSRLVRVLKFLRLYRVVPEVGDLLLGVRRALRASLVVVVVLFLLTFMLSVVSSHIFGAAAPAHFGEPLTAFYTTFSIFTIEGWYELPDEIVASGHALPAFVVRGYFMAVVLTGGVFGLSLLNAIFVDEMLRNENEAMEAQLSRIEAKLDALTAAAASVGRGEEPPA